MPPSSNAKVVILCGGQGTRMREETEYRPKPMVEVGGRPLLWHIMKIYAAAGLTDFVCCLGYRGAMIKQYFLEYRSLAADVSVNLRSGDVEYHSSESEDWNVTLVDTGDDSMTGARVKRVAHHLAGDLFLCTYGDGLADIDVAAALEFHRSHGKLATLTGVHPPSRFGELVHTSARVARFAEKPAGGSGLVSGGFFIFDRRVLERPGVRRRLRARARAARGSCPRRRADGLRARRLLAVRRHGARRRAPARPVGQRPGAVADLGRPPGARCAEPAPPPQRSRGGRVSADLRVEADAVRRIVLEAALAAGTCHIGSSLSIVDILTVLYFRTLRAEAGDRFLLSKGHAASALYAVLARTGALDEREVIAGYCSDGGAFAGHPERHVPGVEVTAGSLGHGVAVALGYALADRSDARDRRTYCLVGDGELNEGSIWEAVALAGHLGIRGIALIVDANGFQGLGRVQDVLLPGAARRQVPRLRLGGRRGRRPRPRRARAAARGGLVPAAGDRRPHGQGLRRARARG